MDRPHSTLEQLLAAWKPAQGKQSPARGPWRRTMLRDIRTMQTGGDGWAVGPVRRAWLDLIFDVQAAAAHR